MEQLNEPSSTPPVAPLPENHGKKKQAAELAYTSEAPLHLVPKIRMDPHTVFIMCGPVHSGKSVMADNLVVLADHLGLNVIVLSSDDCRQKVLSYSELVGETGRLSESEQHISGTFAAASPAAFKILQANYEAHLSYPVSTPVIILDTTALNEAFREYAVKTARAQGYRVVLVLFDYKHRSDYVPEGSSSAVSKAIDDSAKRFRKQVMPNLKAKAYDEIIRIKNRDAFGWDKDMPHRGWTTEQSEVEWVLATLPQSEEYDARLESYYRGYDAFCTEDPPPAVGYTLAVIGDSHECVEELTQLIASIEKLPGEKRIVHSGDYLDKGGNTLAMVALMKARVAAGDKVIRGNHERFVYERLNGRIAPNPGMEAATFSSVAALEANEAARKDFFDLYEASYDFIVIKDQFPGAVPVYLTHAPAPNWALGKVHGDALKAQRNYRIDAKDEAGLFKELEWLYEQSNHILPLSVFGHVAHNAGERGKGAPTQWNMLYKNSLFLDTGCVYGGHLSAAIIKKGQLEQIISVAAKEGRYCLPGGVTLPKALGRPPQAKKAYRRDDYDLEPREERQLKHVLENGIRYISGTMAPAPAVEDDIESLTGGLLWYKKLGVDKVILQPKHMGSRGNLYLFEGRPEATFLTSRNGWLVRGLSGLAEEEYKVWLQVQYEKYKTFGVVGRCGDCIVDCEIEPWDALGRGLIESAFGTYATAIESEVKNLDADPGLAELTKFKEALGLPGRKEAVAQFKEVADYFGKQAAPYTSGFGLLWSARTDAGLTTEEDVYKLVSGKEDHLVISDTASEEEWARAREYFDKLTVEQKMEGLVIKPLDRNPLPNVPAYMKVRSKRYLRLVYGYDYEQPEKYARLCRGKSIGGKLRLSLEESRLGRDMLAATDPQEMEEAIVRMIGLLRQESQLDPRL